MKKEEMTNEMTLEETFLAIEELLQTMEEEDLSLEDTFAKYEEGMKLIQSAGGKIDRVEKKLQILQADGSVKEEL